jgi:hypothetical protein
MSADAGIYLFVSVNFNSFYVLKKHYLFSSNLKLHEEIIVFKLIVFLLVKIFTVIGHY